MRRPAVGRLAAEMIFAIVRLIRFLQQQRPTLIAGLLGAVAGVAQADAASPELTHRDEARLQGEIAALQARMEKARQFLKGGDYIGMEIGTVPPGGAEAAQSQQMAQFPNWPNFFRNFPNFPNFNNFPNFPNFPKFPNFPNFLNR